MSITVGTAQPLQILTDQFDIGFYGTGSVTVASGTQRLLVRVSGHVLLLTAITFNGDALTNVSGAELDDGDGRGVQIWYLDNPDVGTFTLRINSPATLNYEVVASELTSSGTSITTVDATANYMFDTTISTSVTSATGDVVLDVAAGGYALTADGSQTSEVTAEYPTGNFRGFSRKAGGASSTTMQWTASTASRVLIGAISLRESGGGGGTPLRAYYL